MKVKGLLSLMLLLVACDRQVAPDPGAAEKPAATQTQAAPEPAQSAQQFWTDFRAAALAEDAVTLQKMVRFPFITRGATDDDPSVPHDDAAFAALLPKILAQDTGLTKEGETVHAYLESHADLPPVSTGGGESVAVGNDATQFAAGPLRFEKVGNRWYWVSAYLEE